MSPSTPLAGAEEHESPLDAGEFSTWLAATRAALAARKGSDVPCGTCVGCCSSAYFVHIEADETETLKRVPKALLFPAPGLPAGHKILGYDDQGRCPMLKGATCTIYEFRPRACRQYDCRVFPAASLVRAGGPEKSQLNNRITRWRFSYATAGSQKAHEAVGRAARFLDDHPEQFPAEFLPHNPAQRAVIAVQISHLFLEEPLPDARQSLAATIVAHLGATAAPTESARYQK